MPLLPGLDVVKQITVSGVIESTVVFTDILREVCQGTLSPMTGSLIATYTPGPTSPLWLMYKVCGDVAWYYL
jgi:hypothetical protein